jgi:antirestriction protein ArdC
MDIYQTVTDRIIALLEAGTCPWRKSWSAGAGMPRNLISKKDYRGINPFLLSAMPYSSPYWLTYNQAVAHGGNVRRGEKSSMVVFWKMLDKKATTDQDEEAATKHGKIPMLKFYNVFSVEQCEGLTLPPEPEEVVNEFKPIEKAAQIVQGYKGAPVIRYGGNRAFFRPSDDIVQMPHQQTFEHSEDFYAVLYHELGHSTGAKNRLARKEVVELNTFGSHDYSVEELVAEFTASFLCANAGIGSKTIDMSASYIDSWLSVLRRKDGDKKMLVVAAARAQTAADLILNRRPGGDDDTVTEKTSA